MYDEQVKRLRDLQSITEHCGGQSCGECENRELCDKYDNKTLSGIYKEAADAIEKLSAADVRPNNTGAWELSEIYKGYVYCPYCHDCYVEPEWITKMKWRYCPSCGSRLEIPEVEE